MTTNSNTAIHSNQHYVSQVLLRRFTDSSGHLQRFCLRTNKWKQKSPKSVFSRIGYTQVIINGVVENSLETSFKALEDNLPIALKALDEAANGGNKRLEENVYDNLLWYCSYLWCMSPFAKAVAPFDYIVQLDSDLKRGRTDLLAAIGIHESNFKAIRDLHSKGQKFILKGENFLQPIFRVMFNHKSGWEFDALKRLKWTLYHSPIEIPVPDVAFLKFEDRAEKAIIHILPISPKLVFIGCAKFGVPMHRRTETTIGVDTLTQSEAEYMVQAICLSGITAIACNTRTHDIVALRQLAAQRGIHFVKIKDLDTVLSAGTKDMNKNIMLMLATDEEHKNYKKSFVEN